MGNYPDNAIVLCNAIEFQLLLIRTEPGGPRLPVRIVVVSAERESK